MSTTERTAPMPSEAHHIARSLLHDALQTAVYSAIAEVQVADLDDSSDSDLRQDVEDLLQSAVIEYQLDERTYEV